MNIKNLKKEHLAVVVVGLVIVVASLSYLSIPKFPIYKNDINFTNYNSCLEEKESDFEGSVVPGNIIVSFSSLTMNDEAKELLAKYYFDTSGMQYPKEYWVLVDFTGDESGFIKFLEGIEGVHKADRGHTNVFRVVFGEDFPKKQVEDTIKSYSKVNISRISFNLGGVWGIIRVNPGEEKYYACELEQYGIIIGAHSDSIGSLL
jgi:hypothetical protein